MINRILETTIERKREKELCVSCSKETEYFIDMNIEYRKYYVEGGGQLCPECYERIYGKQ